MAACWDKNRDGELSHVSRPLESNSTAAQLEFCAVPSHALCETTQ
jgi:hypothetical protein